MPVPAFKISPYFGTASLFFDLPFQTHTWNNYRGQNAKAGTPQSSFLGTGARTAEQAEPVSPLPARGGTALPALLCLTQDGLLRSPLSSPPSRSDGALSNLKARLDGALSTLVWWKMSLLMAGGWNQMIFKGPSNPNHSDSTIL